MIALPDFKLAFGYENDFHLSCDISRLSKILAHYELFKLAAAVPGDIVECGVFKGTSFVTLAAFRELLGATEKRMIGFDMFGKFPEAGFEADRGPRERFIGAAGDESISLAQLESVLAHKRLDHGVELVAGDITRTVPQFVADHPDLQISLMNLDTDLYEPAVTILEHLYPRLMPGGILMLDDYGVFPGETRAVDDYFAQHGVAIQRFPFRETPCFIVKPAANS